MNEQVEAQQRVRVEAEPNYDSLGRSTIPTEEDVNALGKLAYSVRSTNDRDNSSRYGSRYRSSEEPTDRDKRYSYRSSREKPRDEPETGSRTRTYDEGYVTQTFSYKEMEGYITSRIWQIRCWCYL